MTQVMSGMVTPVSAMSARASVEAMENVGRTGRDDDLALTGRRTLEDALLALARDAGVEAEDAEGRRAERRVRLEHVDAAADRLEPV